MRAAAPPLFLAAALAVHAEGSPLSLRLVGPATITAEARAMVSFAVELTNSGTGVVTPELAIALPAGWRPVGGEGASSLEPGARDTRLISFLVPMQARAGRYTVDVSLRGRADSDSDTRLLLSVMVPPTLSFTLALLEAPSFVVAGQSYSARFLLSNLGNTDLPVALEARGDIPLAIRLQRAAGAQSGILQAGGTEQITVEVATDGRLARAVELNLQLLARLGQAAAAQGLPTPTTPYLARATTAVQIIPVSAGGLPPSHTLPVTLDTTASVSYDGALHATVAELLSAEGSLDEAGKHALELVIRKELVAEDPRAVSPGDTYRMSYQGTAVALKVGDHSFAVSPLLASAEAGRGAEATLSLGPLELGAFAFADPLLSDSSRGLGATLALVLGTLPGSPDPLYQGSLHAYAASAQTVAVDTWQRIALSPGATVELNAALQRDSSGLLTPAVLASTRGKEGDGSWNLRFVRAWPGFVGEYSDLQSFTAGLEGALPSATVGLKGSFELVDRNLALDPLSPAPRALRASLGTNVALPRARGQLQLSWEGQHQTDRIDPALTDSWDTGGRIGLRLPAGALLLDLTASAAWALDALSGRSSLTQAHRIAAELAVGQTARLSAAVAYDGTIPRDTPPDHRLRLELGVRRSGGRTELELKAATSYSFVDLADGTLAATAHAKLATTLPWGHRVAAELDGTLTHAGGSWTEQLAATVSYQVPLEVPVGRIAQASVVHGRVLSSTTGAPYSGVVLRMGDLAAVTNRTGEFRFALPRSGAQYLEIDRATLPAGLIPVGEMPLRVQTLPDKTVEISVALVHGSSLCGLVALYAYPSSADTLDAGDQAAPELARAGGVPNVMVEVSSSTDTRRRVTNARGEWSVSDLPPGTYTVRVAGGSLPPGFALQTAAQQVAAAEGTRGQVEFRVVQERRKLNVLEFSEPVVSDGDGADVSLIPAD